MFYVCITDGKSLFDFAGHFPDKEQRDKRAFWLKSECWGERSTWAVYIGEEPVEAYFVRTSTPTLENETQEDYATRIAPLVAKATNTTKSILTAPEIDDRPEAYR